MKIPKHIIVFLIVAIIHDFCSLFWSKQVTDTQSGMVSTHKIVMRRGVDYARLCETMRQCATNYSCIVVD